MNLTVNPEMEKFIEEQVKAGYFNSPSEVLEAGLARLMLDPEPEELSEEDAIALETAFDQMDRGETIDGEQFHAYIREKYLNGKK
jgi:putative addiction module CopG family antidote